MHYTPASHDNPNAGKIAKSDAVLATGAQVWLSLMCSFDAAAPPVSGVVAVRTLTSINGLQVSVRSPPPPAIFEFCNLRITLFYL